MLGIVAREVVEKYGDRIMEHPVGTGPFMLQEWQRSSRITLVRNPDLPRQGATTRSRPPTTRKAQAIAARMKGRRLPMVDKVVVTIIDEQQPRWLSFLNNEQDFMERLQESFALQAIPNNKLAPNLAKRGIQIEQVPLSDITMFYFSMTHPVVGGYTPDKVALRRAIGAGRSTARRKCGCRGAARRSWRRASSCPTPPSFDPKFRSEMGTFDRARAIALLDMFGYTDKDGDGWRDLPDGKPLVLEYDTLGVGGLPRARRDRQEEPRCGRHQDRVPHRQVARAAAGIARRQADDVGLRLFRRFAQQRRRAAARLQQVHRAAEPLALPERPLRRAVRKAER